MITDDTPVGKYLRKRGYVGVPPAALGYLPACGPHPAAMIATFGLVSEVAPRVIAPPTEVRGVHITRLTADGSKSPDSEGRSKIMKGACKGTPIVLAPPDDVLGLAITEGVEDGLSVYQATGLGVWAAGSAGFMPALAPIVPDWIDCVTISAHPDQAGRRGATQLAQALAGRGIEVLIEGLG
jgi:hypothetical protein